MISLRKWMRVLSILGTIVPTICSFSTRTKFYSPMYCTYCVNNGLLYSQGNTRQD